MLKRLFLSSILMSSIFLHGVLCRGNHGQENASPPPPPAPPKPHSGSDFTRTTVLIPQSTPQNIPPPPLEPDILLPNQCYFGPENVDAVDESSEGYADANALYLLANDPAECSGIIDSFDLCYYITEVVSSYSIRFITFRREYSSNIIAAYRKINGDSMDIERDFANIESGEAFCDIVELDNVLSLSEGDVLGFITTQGFNVALMASDDRSVFRYVPSSDENEQQRKRSFMVNDLQSILATQLIQANNTATPALKIIMNATNSSSQIFPTPTATPTENPSNDPCNRGNSRSISFFTFAAAMVASAITIVALVVVVIILFCCLCGCCVCCAGCCDCKICKVFKICCNKKCLFCCQRKGPGAQKVSGIVDQSMQYNELYLPTDPSKVISGGLRQSTKLHENPSYGQQTTSQSSQSPQRRGLEHTYESIEVSRPRHVL